MTARIAAPLPECGMCETPTLRETHTANGGLCSRCARVLDDTVRMLPPGKVADLGRARRQRLLLDNPPTVFVEAYVPPPPHTHTDVCECQS